MYKYMLSQLPEDWFNKHQSDITSLATDYYFIDTIVGAIRHGVEIKRPFNVKLLQIKTAIKLGISLKAYSDGLLKNVREQAKMEIIKREYGDIIDTMRTFRKKHQERIV